MLTDSAVLAVLVSRRKTRAVRSSTKTDCASHLLSTVVFPEPGGPTKMWVSMPDLIAESERHRCETTRSTHFRSCSTEVDDEWRTRSMISSAISGKTPSSRNHERKCRK